ncbi:carboxylesterase/lipase family protein [Herbiconiux sp. KACC 21604]|uniref:carboxylesterase/lipase family protein n=1 Tax=unclassified Herbiconiux TaxID=2618217 RepID=UPI0014930F9C|nr:carboxylesterase/lipase family protein [Herbiconiux sp. SALV-R1]QJU52737.1 carboxylesterase/lipase family protein [Herbiconiux sp. SALV-R1]WPO87638.1 carboxylesterase/lipase family protein [Herbiconiux sp. KACC 21604]
MVLTNADPLVASTASGAVRGQVLNGVRSWRGIPYGAPPTGPLRFRAPQPPEPWDGVRDALHFGNAAPQHENRAVALPEGVSQSEDCLYLNVTAPADAEPAPPAERALNPVMVWIHGGAYVAGSNAQPLFDGTHLVANGDIVFVALNYRLGALGFLDFSSFSTEELRFETNLGLRDILAGLAWVQQNIAAFGGDPDDVTLFGESAGGGCVTTLLTSPSAAGLFHRAIAESSPTTSVYGQERAARVAARFLEFAGAHPDARGAVEEREEQDGPRPVTPAELLTLPAGVLSQAAFELVAAVSADAPGTLAIGPVVDGDVVPVHPIEAYNAGSQLPLPLIIGTNRDEASLFRLMKSPLMPITQTSVHAMFEQIALERPELDVAALEPRIEGAYPHFPHHRTPAEVSRDAGFRMPSIWLAAAHSRVAPTRMYRFDHSTPALRLLGIGATHGAEIAYVFGNFEITKKDFSFRLGGREAAHRLSAVIQHRWLAFASGRDAVGPGGEPWPLYDEATRSTLVFDHGETVVDDPDAAIRTAWGDQVISFE